MATTAEDKRIWREKAFTDVEVMLAGELDRSSELWEVWKKKSVHDPDRLKWLAYWAKKERILDSLLLKLSKLSSD